MIYLGKRTYSFDDWAQTDEYIYNRVISDDRSAAYATTIDDIIVWWLTCKACENGKGWHKSEGLVISEAILPI